MKLLTLIVTLSFLLASCGETTEQKETSEKEKASSKERKVSEYDYYGEKIDDEGGITMDELMETMNDTDRIAAKVEGQVHEVCERRGCWLTMPYGDEGETIRVVFKDYEFFIPINAAGRDIVIEGEAYWETTDVETLRHYADDAGRSEEEIEAITEPKHEVVFEASGVVLKTTTSEKN